MKKRITFAQFQELQSLLDQAHEINLAQERIEYAACRITGQKAWANSRTFDYIGGHDRNENPQAGAAVHLCADLGLKVGPAPKQPKQAPLSQPHQWNAAFSEYIEAQFCELSATLARIEDATPALHERVAELAPLYLDCTSQIAIDWTDDGLRAGYFRRFDAWLDAEPSRRELWASSGITHSDLLPN